MAVKGSRILSTALAVCLLAAASPGHANTVEKTPSALAMTGDALLARPALFATTVVGSAVFLVSLPFSALGGNMDEAADVLVKQPAKATFIRCLGCTTNARRPETVTQTDE